MLDLDNFAWYRFYIAIDFKSYHFKLTSIIESLALEFIAFFQALHFYYRLLFFCLFQIGFFKAPNDNYEYAYS